MARATRLNEGFVQRLPIGTDAAAVRQRIEAMEHLLERAITIPGIRRKIGLDVLLGGGPRAAPQSSSPPGAERTGSAGTRPAAPERATSGPAQSAE